MEEEVKFKTGIFPFQHLSGNYLEIPSVIVNRLGGKFNLRVVCRINDSLEFNTGLMALGGGIAYIALNAGRMKELGVKPGDSVMVSLKKDHSEFGMEHPLELNEVLKSDAEGALRFERLLAGKKRYIVQYLSKIKSDQLRIERSIRIIENLKKCPEGKEAFRDFLNFKN